MGKLREEPVVASARTLWRKVVESKPGKIGTGPLYTGLRKGGKRGN